MRTGGKQTQRARGLKDRSLLTFPYASRRKPPKNKLGA